MLAAAAAGWWAQAGGAAPAHGPPAAAPRSFVAAQWGLRAIRAKQLQATRHRPLAAVVVATIDSGVALRHPDLRRGLWRNPIPTPAPLGGGVVPAGAAGWDLLGVDPQPEDVVGHGTAVAGLIVAQVGNGGIDGVAANAHLMALKACWRPFGGQLTCDDNSSAAAIDWAAAHGARVIHLSWTLGGGPKVASAVASHPGVLFVANAGNGAGNDIDSTKVNCTMPSPNLICVAGSDRARNPSPCTSVGPVSVDVAAPGVGIATTAL
ncbi:MAG: S8 family serine peptidase, partial [Solirubrobacterales bacterium]